MLVQHLLIPMNIYALMYYSQKCVLSLTCLQTFLFNQPCECRLWLMQVISKCQTSAQLIDQ